MWKRFQSRLQTRLGGKAMTLDEAIKHCNEVAESCNDLGCALDHKQLATWLEELKRFKQHINYDELYDKSHEAFKHSAFDINNGWVYVPVIVIAI